jgi:hypothetical protein
LKKLTKEDQKQYQKLSEELHEAGTEYSTELEDAKFQIEEIIVRCNEKIQTYNEKLDNLKCFVHDIVFDQENYMEEKSDKWHESESGFAYKSWNEGWKEFESELENSVQDDIDMPADFSPDNVWDNDNPLLEPDMSP